MRLAAIFRPGMRTYFIPLGAGLALAGSAFLPWVIVGDMSLRGMSDGAGLWVLGLGGLAVVLAALSLITRKNSRHPLLVVGLMALGVMGLSWRLLPRLATERAQAVSQAFAIVENQPVTAAPPVLAGSGIYLGLTAASIIVVFGFTIVIKRASTPYVIAQADDDV